MHKCLFKFVTLSFSHCTREDLLGDKQQIPADRYQEKMSNEAQNVGTRVWRTRPRIFRSEVIGRWLMN